MHRREIVDGSIEKIFKAHETKIYTVFSCSNELIVYNKKCPDYMKKCSKV